MDRISIIALSIGRLSIILTQARSGVRFIRFISIGHSSTDCQLNSRQAWVNKPRKCAVAL